MALGDKYISTILLRAGASSTPENVLQLLVTVPTFPGVAPTLVAGAGGTAWLKDIVFAPMAALESWYVGRTALVSVHSRVWQGRRTAVTNAFRDVAAGVFIARGMDFPNARCSSRRATRVLPRVHAQGDHVPELPTRIPQRPQHPHQLQHAGDRRPGARGRTDGAYLPYIQVHTRPWRCQHRYHERTTSRCRGGLDADDETKTYGRGSRTTKRTRTIRWTDADLVAHANALADAGLLAGDVLPVER